MSAPEPTISDPTPTAHTGRQVFKGGIAIESAGAKQFEIDETGTIVQPLPGGVSDKGAWAALTAYKAGDSYTNAGTRYLVVDPYTSGAAFGVTDTSNAAALSGGSGVSDLGAWTALTAYKAGTIFTNGGVTYLVKDNYTSGASFGATDTANSIGFSSLGSSTPNPPGAASAGSAVTAMRSDAVIQLPPFAVPVILGPAASGLYTWPWGANGTLQQAGGWMLLSPVIFDRSGTTQMGVNITSAGSTGSVIRFGLYADTGTPATTGAGSPGNLITDFGTVVGTSTGKVFSPTFSVTAGVRYWTAFVSQGAPVTLPTCWQATGGAIPTPPVGTGVNPSNNMAALATSGITGALPGTATVATGAAGTSVALVFVAV